MHETTDPEREARGGAERTPGGVPHARPALRILASPALWLLALVAAAALWVSRPGSAPRPGPGPVVLSRLPGAVASPALSPDGRLLAFSWDRESRGNADIWVRDVGSNTLTRLTTDPAPDGSPVFSPDGLRIAFLRFPSPERSQVLVVPAGGGAESVVAEGKLIRPGMTWSRDGRALVVAERATIGEPSRLSRLSVETGEKAPLTHPPALYRAGDSAPSLSPDGRTLAFARHVSGTSGELWLLAVTDDLAAAGEPVALCEEGWDSGGNAWTPGGKRIVFSVARGFGAEPAGLMTIDVIPRGRLPKPVAGTGHGRSPTSSRTGELAFLRPRTDDNVWRIPLDGGRAGRAVPVAASPWKDVEPRLSADGKRIALCSDRSGSSQVWLCEADGSRAVQLTRRDAGICSGARISPDGRRVVFLSDFVGDMEICLATADGEEQVRLTQSPSHETAPSWSRDGSWIYFGSNREDGFQVWRMRPEPGAPATRVTRAGGYAPVESEDGRTLYYARGETAWSVWKVPVGGGPESLVLPDIANWGAFDVTATALYYVRRHRGKDELRRLRFADGNDELLATLEKPYTFGLSAAPGDGSVLVGQRDVDANELLLLGDLE